MTLDINEQEREFLLDLLRAEHSSLVDELMHTDAFEYRGLLKQKVELLKSLQLRVEGAFSENGTI